MSSPVTVSKQLPAPLRRRNRRLGLLIGVIALAAALWTPWAVHHGWIYPEETTFSFPRFFK